MLDFFHLPNAQGGAETFTFVGRAPSTAVGAIMWQKPRGKSMVNILLVGSGGDGGAGAIGAVSTAAGGGGGGSGAQTRLTMPLELLPDVLYLHLTSIAAQNFSWISVIPETTYNVGQNVLIAARNGQNGGNASGATAGTFGGAAAIATSSDMLLGWPYATAIGGAQGSAGSATASPANLALPTTGVCVSGGAGGAGLGAAGSAGSAGGAIVGSGIIPTRAGGAAPASSTSPPGSGLNGYKFPNAFVFLSGTGGGSTHGSATGGGLVQSSGGDGAPGCGGGGSGGALTGSAAGSPGKGGPSFCIITCW